MSVTIPKSLYENLSKAYINSNNVIDFKSKTLQRIEQHVRNCTELNDLKIMIMGEFRTLQALEEDLEKEFLKEFK